MNLQNVATYVTALLCVALIACSAIQKSPASNDEALITALRSGENFIIEGKTFSKDIDFNIIFDTDQTSSIYLDSELRFTNCTFKGKINWSHQENRKLHFQKDVVFEDCVFEQTVTINDAVFNSMLQIGKSLFRHSLDLQRNSYRLNCRIDDNDFGHDLIVQYSRCHEDLSLFGNNVGNHLLLQGITVVGKTQISNLEVGGSVDLSNAHFHEDFMMDYAKGGKKVLAGNSKFYSRCFIRNLDAFDAVDFSGSYFLGKHMYSSVNNDITPNMEGSYFVAKVL